MAVNPSPLLLLNRRVSELLNNTKVPGGSSLEPQWNPTLVQRVIGATAEAIIDAVANGEEVQFGKLGRFFPKILEERAVSMNMKDVPEKVVAPRRVKVEFEPTNYTDSRIKELLTLVRDMDALAK